MAVEWSSSGLWGHVDICAFWYNFTINYILNIKGIFLELFQKFIRFGNSGLPLCVSILEQTIGFVNNEMQVSIGCV